MILNRKCRMKNLVDMQSIEAIAFFLTIRANQTLIIQPGTKTYFDGINLRVSLFATWGKNFIIATKA